MCINKFSKADLDILGNISIQLGKVYWQESKDLENYEDQLDLILEQHRILSALVDDLLSRETA